MTKILVIDDEKNIRNLYEKELQDEGYAVALAGNGREALERFTGDRPNLVVLDIRMPGMDGLEVLGKLLAEDPKVPVVLNTAYSLYKDNFLSWAADAYVVKSSDLTELMETIRRLLAARPDIPVHDEAPVGSPT